MIPRRSLLLLPFLLAVPASLLAEEGEDERRAARRRRLFERLRNAASEREGRLAEEAIWQFWMAEAPSTDIASRVSDAMTARESYDWDKALAILDTVVADAPDYAEGWNQRAFIRFLKEDFDGSLEDIDEALALEPNHFAALAGKAIVLMRQGRMELGQDALRRAVEIHPWLKERSMLVPVPGEVTPGPSKDI